MSDTPNLWDYRQNFNYDLPLDPGDPLLVDLSAARGQFSRAPILRQLGMHASSRQLRNTHLHNQYLLFGGHRGCGKSTELRALSKDLANPEGFLVIAIDAVKELDVHNLRYCDIALLEAKALIERLQDEGIDVPFVFFDRLLRWFDARVEKIERARSLATELKTGAEASVGLPLVGKLFASLTTAISTNSSYKEEIRREIKDAFSEFAEAFNQLLDFARDAIKTNNLAQSLIFIIDGTDRIQGDDATAFFIQDIHQLRQIKANFIYCTPIHILAEQGQAGQNFDAVFRLPMIKLTEKASDKKIPIAWEKMRELITRRLPIQAFESEATLNELIGACGGHPRDLLRLIGLCFQETDDAPITCAIANKAIQLLAKEYSRLITIDDYSRLAGIDQENKDFTPVNEQTRRLLYDLVLLEYNNFWWQSHPVVRLLPNYRAAL